MKKELFISDLRNHIGKEIKQPFFLKAVFYNENKMNRKWQDLKIEDKSGSAVIKVFAENACSNYDKFIDNVVLITGVIELVRSVPCINVSSIEPCEHFNMADYIPCLSKEQEEFLKARLDGYINLMNDGPYKCLVKKAMSQLLYPMTKRQAGTVNHNYCGALLVHTVEVTEYVAQVIKSQEDFAQFKPYPFELNKDLALAAAILHDVGKYNTFSEFPEMKKTIRGLKVPAYVETIAIVDAYNSSKLDKDNRLSDTSDLRHIFAAVGGASDPMMLEALIVVNACKASDDIDSYSTAFLQSEDQHPGNSYVTAYSSHLEHKVIRERKE